MDESAVFVAFVSEGYLASENCGKEFALAEAWKKVSGGASVYALGAGRRRASAL